MQIRLLFILLPLPLLAMCTTSYEVPVPNFSTTSGGASGYLTQTNIDINDTTPPTFTVHYPENNAFVGTQALFTGNASDDGSSVTGVWLDTGTGERFATPPWDNWQSFELFEAEGSYTYQFRCQNGVGLESTQEITVYSDHTYPTLSITSHENQAHVMGEVELYGTVNDPLGEGNKASGIQTLELKIDDGDWSTIDSITGNDWSYTWDISAISKGTLHTIRFRAQDQVGLETQQALELYVTGWMPIPYPAETIHNEDGAPDQIDMVISGGNPVLVWSEPSFGLNNAVYAKQYNGTSWQSLGGGAIAGGSLNSAAKASLCMFNSKPHLVYSIIQNEIFPPSSTTYIRVMAYSGSSWDLIGDTEIEKTWSIPSEIPMNFTNTIDSDGTELYLAYVMPDGDDKNNLYVKKYTEPNWVDVGDGSGLRKGLVVDIGVSDSPPSLAFNGSTPYIAWVEHTVGFDILNQYVFVNRWTGSDWEDVGLGGIVNADLLHESSHPVVQIHDGTIYVALVQYNGTINQLLVRSYSGTAWTTVGDPLNIAGTGKATPPGFCIHNGELWVAWVEMNFQEEEALYVKKWDADASEWIRVGGVPLNTDDTGIQSPTIGIDDDGKSVVSWVESNWLDGAVYAKTYVE